METIQIKLNKKKFVRILIVSLMFFVLSLFFLFAPQLFLSTVISSKTIILIFGVLGSLFFGISLLYTGRKMLNTKLGLFLFDDGLIDHSTAFGFGRIEWSDISDFKLIHTSNKYFILIETQQAQKYFDRIESKIFAKAALQNMKTYGSPLLIYCSHLQAKPQDLLNLLKTELKKRK